MTTRELVLLVAALVILVAALTLGPHVADLYDLVSAPLAAIMGGRAAEFFLNAVLFLPFGLLAGWSRRGRAVLAVVVLAVAVEAAQSFLGRDAEGVDLLAYVAGAVVGAGAGALLRARAWGEGT